MLKRSLIAGILCLFGLMATSPLLVAQRGRGTSTLIGVVIGPDDKPAPRAAITYEYSDGSGPHAVRADAHGRFTIPYLRASNYDIRASASGIFSEWERNISLRKGQTRKIELRLMYAREMPKAMPSQRPKS